MRDVTDLRHPTAGPTSWVNSGDNVTVTIGRNVGTTPMVDEAWQAFQRDVQDHVMALVHAGPVFVYYGTGEWTDDETGELLEEESAVILFVDVQYTTSTDNVDRVLSTLAAQYDQDAIGWSAGPGRLARR